MNSEHTLLSIPHSAAPERTYAIVAGNASSRLGTEYTLDGAVHDAWRFAQWLVTRGVPHENIALLVSPREEDREFSLQLDTWPRENMWPATRERLDHVIHQLLRPRQGDLLWFFWGGHGFSIPGDFPNRRLLYEDTTRENRNHFVFESLCVHLRSHHQPGFNQQIFLIDACANHVDARSSKEWGKGDTFPCGHPRERCQQYVLFSCKEGQKAVERSQEKAGLFSGIVCEELENTPPTPWPPDMDFITSRIQRRLLTSRQRPIFFDWQSWDGEGRRIEIHQGMSETTSFSAIQQAYRVQFGEMVKQWRIRVRMDRNQLGRFVGGHTRISDKLIKQWEEGIHVPEEIYLRKLIHALIDLHRSRGLLDDENMREAIVEFWICAWCAGAPVTRDPNPEWIEMVMSRLSPL